MSQSNTLRGARVPRVVPILNPLVRRLLGAGVPFGPNVLLTVRGRTSGLPRTFPVAIIEADGRLLVRSTFGQVEWVRNLRADGHATLTRDRRATEIEAVELAPEEAGPLVRAAMAGYMRNAVLARLVRVFVPIDRGAAAEDYVDDVRGHPVFELRPPREPAEPTLVRGAPMGGAPVG